MLGKNMIRGHLRF